MKKLALALVCMFSVAFFASCTKTIEHPEPTIAVMTGDNFITGTVDNPTIIDADDENAINLQYGFHLEANPETKKELKNMVITIDVITYEEDGQVNDVYSDTIDLQGKTSYDFIEYLFVQDRELITLMEGTIKAVVTDVDNQSSAATIAFEVTMDYTPVPLVGHTIEWVRRGNNVLSADEMAEYGLMWDITIKAPFATIKPLQNATMYLCDGDDFDDIVYEDEKYTYFSNLAETATPVESYRNIDANLQHADYNDMLAIIYGEKYSLIRINHADVETGSFGSQITIIGEAK